MAGLYDLDIEAGVLDDIAIGWDDPDNAAAGNNIQVSALVLVGVVARSTVTPEPSAASCAQVGVVARSTVTPEPNAVSRAQVGVVPRSQPSAEPSAVTIVKVGVALRSAIAGSDATVDSIVPVGVVALAGGSLAELSIVTSVRVGVVPRAGAVPEPNAVSCAQVGAVERSTVTPEPNAASRVQVGAVERSQPSVQPSAAAVVLVGVVPRSQPTVSALVASAAFVGVASVSSPTASILADASVKVGVALISELAGVLTGSAAIVLNRMIVLGYGSIPISQDLVDRRKRRGGMEPPTRPAERRDFFDVRRVGRTIDERVEFLEDVATPYEHNDTWTPSLNGSGVTQGNAVVQGSYLWIGGPDVGDHGVLIMTGEIELGSTTVLGTTAYTIPPTGFEMDMESGSPIRHLGDVEFNIGGARYNGRCVYNGSAVLQFFRFTTTGEGHMGNITSSEPAAWATGDTFNFHAVTIGKRV